MFPFYDPLKMLCDASVALGLLQNIDLLFTHKDFYKSLKD